MVKVVAMGPTIRLRARSKSRPGRPVLAPCCSLYVARVEMEHNLARLAEDSYRRRGDYESLLFDGRWHESGELFDRACRMAGGLVDLGISPGDRVVVTMANCPEVG